MKWNWKVQKSASTGHQCEHIQSTSTYKKSLKPPDWMPRVCMVWYPVVCMVWYPGLHNCPHHRTAPANEADIIRNKTADTSQIHKQKHNCCSNMGWDVWWWPIHNGRCNSLGLRYPQMKVWKLYFNFWVLIVLLSFFPLRAQFAGHNSFREIWTRRCLARAFCPLLSILIPRSRCQLVVYRQLGNNIFLCIKLLQGVLSVSQCWRPAAGRKT